MQGTSFWLALCELPGELATAISTVEGGFYNADANGWQSVQPNLVPAAKQCGNAFGCWRPDRRTGRVVPLTPNEAESTNKPSVIELPEKRNELPPKWGGPRVL